ncbi:MAG TPA: DmsE family decaheme c-type cytochrome [Terriglobales bacterium]|nr:DmsE family decaheme c-type cytochrome [Terriglobales bacterium]
MKRSLWPFVALMLSLMVLPMWSADKPSDKPSPQAKSDNAASSYVGSEPCLTCHEDVYRNQFERTPHFQTVKKGHGCESCHGPGAEHVAGGGDKSKIVSFTGLSRQESSRRCLECHGNAKAQHFSGSSAHMSNQVGCVDCHSPHHPAEPEHLLVKKQPELCYSCHANERAEFSRPYHHRVNEGLVTCNDCHSVHGSSSVGQVRESTSGDAGCMRCHTEKQGPFVYEHVPVKTEGCSSCHTPHGSTNPRLLRVSNVDLLCLQCHSYPGLGPSGPAHNQSQKYQACTMCHTQIHGSNANTAFLQ